MHFNAIFTRTHGFYSVGKNLATNQSWKQRLLVESVYFRHICHTLLDLSHEMSQIDQCDCAMFVSQHCSANIKASAQGSSWKFKNGLSRNQVEAPVLNVDEARDKIFQALDCRNSDWIKPLEWSFAQLMSVWKHYQFMVIGKLQITPNCGNRGSTLIHLVYSVLMKQLLHKRQYPSSPTF